MDIISFVMGFLLGLCAGFLPGIHPNTLASVLSTSPLSDHSTAMMLIGMFPANVIASFVPAIFFGIPEAGTLVSALPGHRMTMQGKGLIALKTVLISILIAILFAAFLFYPSLFVFPYLYSLVKPVLKYIVLILAGILIFKSRKKFLAAVVFICAGLLGYFSLNSEMPDPFMPLFSGMFAVGALLNMTESKIPKQKKEGMFKINLVPYILLGVLFGLFADVLPGISSPSQMATFMGIAVPMNSLAYLSSVSSISISESLFSLSTNVSIDKSRIGTTAWLSEFINIEQNLILLIILFILSASMAALILYLLRRKISAIAVMNSRPIAVILIVYLFIVAALLDGFLGIIVFIVASGLGWITVKLGVERTQLMGAVIIPTLMLLFGIFL